MNRDQGTTRRMPSTPTPRINATPKRLLPLSLTIHSSFVIPSFVVNP
jgi:hypothetical protein